MKDFESEWINHRDLFDSWSYTIHKLPMTPRSPAPSASSAAAPAEGLQFGIGALSEATGVPAPTLRTWERRYGFPVAARTAGGQRVYAADMVDQVRLAARAMELGHRPAAVFRVSVDELHRLVDLDGTAPLPVLPTLDGAALETEFRRGLAGDGLWGLLHRRIVPLLAEVGDAWAAGRLSVYEEHLYTERLREFLVSCWRPMADRNGGPVGLCATFPGEHHALGLHLAACALALEGWRVVFLGVDVPLDQIGMGARSSGARAVFLSVSAGGGSAAAGLVTPLRALLPETVALVLGGDGASAHAEAVVLGTLDALRVWLHDQG